MRNISLLANTQEDGGPRPGAPQSPHQAVRPGAQPLPPERASGRADFISCSDEKGKGSRKNPRTGLCFWNRGHCLELRAAQHSSSCLSAYGSLRREPQANILWLRGMSPVAWVTWVCFRKTSKKISSILNLVGLAYICSSIATNHYNQMWLRLDCKLGLGFFCKHEKHSS